MPNTKTIELTGSETEVRFGENYPYFWVRNHGSGDVYMSALPGIVPGADGVTLIPAGEGRSTGDLGQANVLYFLGSGKIEISPQHNAARLAAYLLHKNGLTADNLYTHTYWLHVRDGHTQLSDTANIDKWCTAPHTYKNCPLYIIPDWIGFKKLVDGYVKQLGGSSVVAVGTFLVRILDPALNIRAQPSLTAKINGVIRGKGVYTIVATSFEPKTQITWGKLKSGAGWISLGSKYVKKI